MFLQRFEEYELWMEKIGKLYTDIDLFSTLLLSVSLFS